MYPKSLVVPFLALATSAEAVTQRADSHYNTIRDGAGVGYQYTENGCNATTTRDLSGNIWAYVNRTSINDGTSVFNIPLLRRDDLKAFVIVFPGSSNTQNFQQDAMTTLVNYNNPSCNGCQIHQGFLQAWNAVRTPVITLIKSNIQGPYANYNLISAGGSLGGALASLAFAEFRTNTALGLVQKTVQGYSYGQPRTGNFAFAKWFNDLAHASSSQIGDFMRVTHGYDSIPRSPYVAIDRQTPNTTPDSVYQHHGTEIWEQDNISNGNHPSPSTTYICWMRADQSESTDCVGTPANPGNTGDHVAYAGYGGPVKWETVACGR